jgi:hypothetical protein
VPYKRCGFQQSHCHLIALIAQFFPQLDFCFRSDALDEAVSRVRAERDGPPAASEASSSTTRGAVESCVLARVVKRAPVFIARSTAVRPAPRRGRAKILRSRMGNPPQLQSRPVHPLPNGPGSSLSSSYREIRFLE